MNSDSIYERLRDKAMSPAGSYCDGVYSEHRKQLIEEKETYVDLYHLEKEAKVDFGTDEII
ncbi:hypothetical protein A7K69_16990 [Parageobacillus thermoglucosidasius]|uniref:Uncharacterized protein n=1 Tax=Parageobacillus thermoglucosidasius TaxID=1426 RepID=A0A1B7KV69_PARTM|nr:hypothetical protein A7K69_16990 [Parageobacillus thermoglucosidasius]